LKRTFFDKIIVGIMLLLAVAFFGVAGYMIYATQRVLVSEKQSSLINEANLLSNQTIGNYLKGYISLNQVQRRFDEFDDSLKTHIWFYGTDGNLIAASNPEDYSNLPENIYDLDSNIELEDSFTRTGTFYDIFEGTVISIGIPVYSDKELAGYMILHTAMTELEEVQDEMLNAMYIPFFGMLLVVVLVLIFFSGTILRPLSKINRTAREYAKGNFEAKTGVKRKDELGELADSLEYMAGELNKLDEYRKNFIANISHDFRSPLTSIKGYLEAMLDGTIPVEKYDRYLNIVLNESQRLTKLTEGLLELNDFDTYGPVLKRQRFDIVDVVKETRNTFEGRCEEKNIDFRLVCPAKDTFVYADKMKIGQVVYNLVDNAIKFSSDGGKIVVTISQKNDKIFVSVKDEGPGIEKDKQNKVWVRFYKTDSSRGKDKQGTGLGLSITKEIIKAHGENINLISTEGAGSEFVFSLSKGSGEKKENVIG
jgi:signal transduction histidine kinase